MNITFVSSEVVPFSKTGGLADVAGALPVELAKLGHRVSVYTPYYRCVKKMDPKAKLIAKGTASVGLEQLPWTLHAASSKNGESVSPSPKIGAKKSGVLPPLAQGSLQFYFVGNDAIFDREGIYGTPQGDYEDNCKRFAFFCQATLAAVETRTEPVDLWHCHDWQTALIPVYLKTTLAGNPFFSRGASVLTIHNLAYRGLFWHWDWPLLNLPWKHYNWRELEFHGKMSLLKGALVHSDILVTVSPTYAREIQTAEFGYGLEGVLSERRDILFGIVNGIDTQAWNPRTDALLPATYSAEKMEGKRACKQALRRKFNLPDDSTAVVGMIGRLAEQKGFDLVARSGDELVKRHIQLVVLGTGSEGLEKWLRQFQAAHPQKIAMAFAFDDALAHLIEAGSDMFVMPSRYEPCGLSQLYSQAYGTVPIVRRVGGLADTVTDATPEALANGTATGFQFQDYTPQALMGGLDRALKLYFDQPEIWRKLQFSGMSQDWSWPHSALKYLDAYECALKLKVLRQK